MGKGLGNRQKPGWQRVRKVEPKNQKKLLKEFQEKQGAARAGKKVKH
jgi:hypothetical protein